MAIASNQGRMLLSHNFDLYHNELPKLNKQQFAQIFIEGLKEQQQITCSPIENPHWIVEIIYPSEEISARQIGEQCSQILLQARQSQKPTSQKMPDILVLGGKKTTPAMGTSPTSLQPGEWGVDVVETADEQTFLQSIKWEEMIAQKPAENIFEIILKSEKTSGGEK